MTLAETLVRWNVVDAPDHESWLRARTRFVTASNASTLLGVNPYMTWRRLVAETRTALTAGQPVERSAPAMRAGQFLEPGVFAWWMDDIAYANGKRGLPAPVGSTCRHPSGASMLVAHPNPDIRLAASPDGLADLGDRMALVEVKVHGPKAWAKVEDEDVRALVDGKWAAAGLPPKRLAGETDWAENTHYVQLQTQMLVTGVDYGVVVRCCGTERRDTYFHACPDLHRLLEAATMKFWADVLEG